LATGLQTGAVLSTERVGDVVGVQFPNEEDVALFIPGSGDVLLCTAAQWHSLKAGQVGSPTGLSAGPLHSASVVDAAPAVDLKSTLLSLGALLA
jgi:hypothetical protein